MKSITDMVPFNVRVSSTLNKNVSQYGKKFMFDGNDDSCWNSHSGTSQWIVFEFNEEQTIASFSIQFQGGFVGQDCSIELMHGNNIYTEQFYPDDNNKLQNFSLKQSTSAKCIKFNFNKSTDFFGRITIYKFNIYSDS